MSAIGREEVLEAKMVCLGAAASKDYIKYDKPQVECDKVWY